ncbi:fungal hydrophobin [Agrocybe pediades]|nr:fungal hydrophobin [Agrocybe pediades]
MVLYRSITSIAATIPVLAGASELTERQAQCNTGFLLCCNQVEPASSPVGQTILAIFGIPAGSVSGLIGLTCSPISTLGVSSQCTAQPVCCTNNSYNGVIALNCVPINLNL